MLIQLVEVCSVRRADRCWQGSARQVGRAVPCEQRHAASHTRSPLWVLHGHQYQHHHQQQHFERFDPSCLSTVHLRHKACRWDEANILAVHRSTTLDVNTGKQPGEWHMLMIVLVLVVC